MLKIEIGRTATKANGDTAYGEMKYAWTSHDYMHCGSGSTVDECKADAAQVVFGNSEDWKDVEVFNFDDSSQIVDENGARV